MVSRKEVWISPIDGAVSTIVDKNKELHDKIENVLKSEDSKVDIGPLSMTLNGMIDAAVNGGISKYFEVGLEILSIPHLNML